MITLMTTGYEWIDEFIVDKGIKESHTTTSLTLKARASAELGSVQKGSFGEIEHEGVMGSCHPSTLRQCADSNP